MRKCEANDRKAGDPGPCDDCGQPGTWQIEPYLEEIHGDTVWQYICPTCYHNSCMDI